MTVDANEFWRVLEQSGEETVRRRLAEGVYGDEKRKLVIAWLESRDKGKIEKREEQKISIADRAQRAAWISAIASVISAICACIAAYYATR